MKVIKRDGSVATYQTEKISIAISGAFNELGKEFFDDAVIADVENVIYETYNDIVGIEDIQDIVEDVLIEHGYITEAKAYIRYRYEHSKQRERQKQFDDLIRAKLRASDVQNQNANVDEMSFGGRMGEAANELMKKIALEEYVSPMARNNHLNNEIYIHKNIVA